MKANSSSTTYKTERVTTVTRAVSARAQAQALQDQKAREEAVREQWRATKQAQRAKAKSAPVASPAPVARVPAFHYDLKWDGTEVTISGVLPPQVLADVLLLINAYVNGK